MKNVYRVAVNYKDKCMRLRAFRLRVMFVIALGLGLNSIPGTSTFAQATNLCGYPNSYSGVVTAPNETFVSPSYTQANGASITINACLSGPANLNFDLLLYKTVGGPGGGGWLLAATGVSTGPNQRSLSFTQSVGTTNYTLKVRPNGGSGTFTASWRIGPPPPPPPPPPPAACAVPPYVPSFWNNTASIQNTNNCYNYATNTRTDTFAQPGRYSGAWCTTSGCVNAATISGYTANDGLSPSTASSTCASGMDKVALVIWPGFDYHFYRLDSDGKWSHKPGQTPARNTDNSSALITNPETANRGNYTVFAGYFCTCSSATQGAGGAHIN